MGLANRLSMNATPDERPIKRPLTIVLGTVAILAGLAAAFFFRNVLLATVVALIIGVLLEPVIRTIKTRLHAPHSISVLLTILIIVGVFGGIAFGGYSLVADQARSLAEQAPQIRERITTRIDNLVARFPWLGSAREEVEPSHYIERAGGAVFKTLRVGTEGLTYALVVLILALYIAANFRSYGAGLLTAFPPGKRPRVAALAEGSVLVVRKWFVSQMIVVSISALLTAIALVSIGFDYWLVIAGLTLILDFIPFIGAIVTGVVASILTLGTQPEKIWWVLLIYVAIQQIENDILMPLIMKGRIRLPEAHLLVFVLVMGAAFGVIGIFLAPPVFAVLHHLYGEAYLPWVEGRSGRD